MFRIRRATADNKKEKEILNKIIPKYSLTNKEITKKLEEKEDNPKFVGKLLRSLKNNVNDTSAVLARKLGKHCKRESTENKNKRDKIKIEHIHELIDKYNVKNLFKHDKRFMFLDNAPAHTTDLVYYVADILNIEFIPMPKYAPWLNPVETVWEIQKYDSKYYEIDTKSKLKKTAFKSFNNKCKQDSLTKNFKEKIPAILMLTGYIKLFLT